MSRKTRIEKEDNKRGLVIYIAVLIAIMVFIFIQSAFPATVSRQESGVVVKFLEAVFGLSPDNAAFIVRKTGHFLEYLVLGVVLCLTARSFERKRSVPLWIPWAVGTAFAVTDEIHQYFVPGRSCELRDVVIDGFGVAVGVLIVRKRVLRTNT